MTDELYTQTEGGIRYWTREELLIRAETAEAEVAALRAQVAELEAADQWRPISEPPGAPGEYLGWDGYRTRVIEYFPEQYTDWPWYDDLGIEIPITHWRPLNEPPQEAPAA